MHLSPHNSPLRPDQVGKSGGQMVMVLVLHGIGGSVLVRCHRSGYCRDIQADYNMIVLAPELLSNVGQIHTDPRHALSFHPHFSLLGNGSLLPSR